MYSIAPLKGAILYRYYSFGYYVSHSGSYLQAGYGIGTVKIGLVFEGGEHLLSLELNVCLALLIYRAVYAALDIAEPIVVIIVLNAFRLLIYAKIVFYAIATFGAIQATGKFNAALSTEIFLSRLLFLMLFYVKSALYAKLCGIAYACFTFRTLFHS